MANKRLLPQEHRELLGISDRGEADQAGNFSLVVAGDGQKFGSNYVIILRSYDTESGRLLGSEEAMAADLDGLWVEVEAAGERLFEWQSDGSSVASWADEAPKPEAPEPRVAEFRPDQPRMIEAESAPGSMRGATGRGENPERPILGFGGTVAVGVGTIVSGSVTLFAPGAAFEFRLYPTRGFSIDFQFNILAMVLAAASGQSSFQLDTGFHFRLPSHTKSRFLLGPFVGFGVANDGSGDSSGGVRFGGRIGGEARSDRGRFAFGVYCRPMLFVASSSSSSDISSGLVIQLELTWTGLVLAPAS